MEKILLLSGVVFSLCSSPSAEAQVNVNVQIGRPVVQEQWYANDNDYYYLPEQGVYYNVRRQGYVYPEGGRWMYADRLPSRYGSYSYRNSQYVTINDRSPFNRHNVYRQKYRGNGNNPHNNGRHDNGNHNGWNKKSNSANRSNERVIIREVDRGRGSNDRGNNRNGNDGRGNKGNGNGGRGNGRH